ncbi:MAG: 50S ribosomal protein L23 [Armatimonadota bacterium]
MRSPYEIILHPVITERSTDNARMGRYTFAVAPDANKIDIKRAIEAIYRVNVLKVNVMNVRGKRRRIGRMPVGETAGWKKAIVTVQPGQRIEAFEVT